VCTRAVCALSHVFEAAGLATVALVSILGQAQRARPPRALYCDFPLGRPLGHTGDPQYQHGVLRAAFSLLDEPCDKVPVLAQYPEVIHDSGDEPLACALPARYDPDAHPAVDEARGLVHAFERTRLAAGGRTGFGKVLGAENVGVALEAFAQVAAGASWEEVGPVPDPVAASTDIRSFYEEAALSLADHTPAARQAEAWFFNGTEAGKVLLAAQRAMKAAGNKASFLVVPLNRHE
jgi:hypothetical protein